MIISLKKEVEMISNYPSKDPKSSKRKIFNQMVHFNYLFFYSFAVVCSVFPIYYFFFFYRKKLPIKNSNANFSGQINVNDKRFNDNDQLTYP